VYRKGVKPGSGISTTLSKKGADNVKNKYAALKKQQEEYDNAEDNFAKASKARWDSIG
jgi:hypothetical protein